MKFKKDGKVFDSVGDIPCLKSCRDCAVDKYKSEDESCLEFMLANPAEAARLMGYEVVVEETGWTLAEDGDGVVCPHCGADFCTLVYNAEEFIFCPSCGKKVKKEANMDKQKPLKDWTMEEVQNICAASGSDCEGCPFAETGICRVDGIPENWDLSEKPRFTEAEVADARAILRIEHLAWTTLVRKMDNALWLNDGEGGWHELRPGAFPSILPGQSVKLSDIVGGDTE